MPTITNEITLATSTPLLVMTSSTEFESGNIVHRLIGTSEPYISLRPHTLRSGVHMMFYDDETLAMNAVNLLRQPGGFTLSYVERPSFEMRFILTDRLEMVLEPTKEHWQVVFGFQELSP